MKKLIKASKGLGTIFEDENFEFIRESGIGINHTPWTGLDVKTKGGSLADKHAVSVRLHASNWPKFEGQPVEWKYSDAYVNHGSRMTSDTLEETREYIDVLEDAIDFAERVNAWLHKYNEGIADESDFDYLYEED